MNLDHRYRINQKRYLIKKLCINTQYSILISIQHYYSAENRADEGQISNLIN